MSVTPVYPTTISKWALWVAVILLLLQLNKYIRKNFFLLIHWKSCSNAVCDFWEGIMKMLLQNTEHILTEILYGFFINGQFPERNPKRLE